MNPSHHTPFGSIRFCVAAAAIALAAAAGACTTETPPENFLLLGQSGTGGTAAGGSGATAPTTGGRPSRDAGMGGVDGGGLQHACGEAPIVEGAFTQKLLRQAAADCAIWHYCVFEDAARQMNEAVAEYAEARTDDALEVAQATWRTAMESWSAAELFQFGPAGSTAEDGKDVYQGRNIRDRIYAWPRTARCRVEEQLLSRSFEADGMDRVLISARGLFALEYLLFYPGQDTGCRVASIQDAWAKLGSEQITDRKIAYSVAVAADIHDSAVELLEAWQPAGGNFKELFVQQPISGYRTEQEAMNVMAWSLAYIEREVKDWKLGVPAGIILTAPVTGPEAAYAGFAVENLRANLRGFRSLFQGCGPGGEGIGFDDWLIKANHAELAEEIIHEWELAQAAVDALPALDQASVAELEAAYQAMRPLTTSLKTQFFGNGPLSLELPMTLEGDTD